MDKRTKHTGIFVKETGEELKDLTELPDIEPYIFKYGVIEFKKRFNINLSLDDYKVTTLNKCIRMVLVYKFETMACDKLIAEVQIVYKDEDDNLRCLKADLHDFTFAIKHKGDMQINL